MNDTVLKVTGMTCGHRVMSVTKALQQVPGVAKAEVSLEKGEAVVHGAADAQAMLAAVKQAGYAAALKS